MIFISHRHADAHIARVVKEHLMLWGFHNDAIFQSSGPGTSPSAGQGGPRPGGRLRDEIQAALYQTKVVILIYTQADEDWAWCMFECGLATDPQKPEGTRVILFQCNEYEPLPGPFEGEVVIKVDNNGIRGFTTHLLCEDEFIPGEPARFQGDDPVRRLSDAFYAELRRVIRPPRPLEERHRWDSFTLRLQSVPDDLRDEETDGRIMQRILESELTVVRYFGEALMHFGYATIEEGLTLQKLVDRWKVHPKTPTAEGDDWVQALYSEIHRTIKNFPAGPEWHELVSVTYGTPYYPVVNHARILPDESMEFDVFFFRSLKRVAG